MSVSVRSSVCLSVCHGVHCGLMVQGRAMKSSTCSESHTEIPDPVSFLDYGDPKGSKWATQNGSN